MEKDPIFAEAERLYMLENPGGCLAAEDETVKRYWMQCAVDTSQQSDQDSMFMNSVRDAYLSEYCTGRTQVREV